MAGLAAEWSGKSATTLALELIIDAVINKFAESKVRLMGAVAGANGRL